MSDINLRPNIECQLHAEYSPGCISVGLPNLLFETSTFRLSAIVDFDFSHIGAPISECLFSFYNFEGLFPGSAEPLGRLRELILAGFPKDIDEGSNKLGRAWDNALDRIGSQRPSTIAGADQVADIWWFSQELCQAYWLMERFISKNSPEKLDKYKKEAAANLDKYLTQWGY